MYSHCLVCTHDLGTNDWVDAFPVGRRLAFHARSGRLWVVCSLCGRWNLTPLDVRWEALESCERLFRDTQRQVSTPEIGLARLPDGVDLVRIGSPVRDEFAAWRYGRTFMRRWRRERLTSAAFTSGGIFFPLSLPLLLPAAVWQELRERSVVARLPGTDGEPVLINRRQARRTRLQADDDGGWTLVATGRHDRTAELRGDPALRAAGLLLPHLNRRGATELQVKVAVNQLERHGTGLDYFRAAAPLVRSQPLLGNSKAAIHRAPAEIRLALEMAAHEESERRAMEGELRDLLRAWQEAEEVAAIADDLLLPAKVRSALNRLHRPGGPQAGESP